MPLAHVVNIDANEFIQFVTISSFPSRTVDGNTISRKEMATKRLSFEIFVWWNLLTDSGQQRKTSKSCRKNIQFWLVKIDKKFDRFMN